MEDEQPAREANKTCGVCGDRALGYNFNAVSCESCKAFFRRNALKNKDFRCPFTENCNITPVTRRFCQKCRLDKCFSIGMRKEYIMSEEDKVLKRQKIELNRARKRPRSENVKSSKSRKNCVDDCSLEDSSMSVNSVVSTVSDTYFWESDKKYTDLDANKQNVTESMSPVTAASVPSPCSPQESASIVRSKAIDPLKETSHECGSSYDKFEQSSLQYEENEGDVEGTSVNSDLFDEASQKFSDFVASPNTDSKKCEKNTKKYETDLLDLNSEFSITNNASPKCSPEYQHTRSYSKFEQSPVQSSVQSCVQSSTYVDNLNSETQRTLQDLSVQQTVCQKPVETCPKENSLINKITHDPSLAMKLASNPNFVAKIFQDQDLILKIMTNPDVVTKLAEDPQVVQFLEQDSDTDEEETKSENLTPIHFKRSAKTSNSPSNISKPILRTKERRIENPILTDLITSSNQEECTTQRQTPSTSTAMSSDCNKNVTDVTRDVLQDVQRIPIVANSIESILCEAIKLEFSAYSALGGTQTRRELNDAERAKLNELIVANKALLAPLDEDITSLVGEEYKIKSNLGKSDSVLIDLINLTAIAIRRLIKMAKRINAFKSMCQEDQIALLKGGCTEMMILRSAVNYDPERDLWRIPHTQESMSRIKAEVLKEAKGNLYAEHARFVRSFDLRWRDENIILILSAIALFTPNRPKVVHNDVIKLEQNSYYYLLRRYLESIYPGCEAKSMFLKLIQKISDLHRLNNEVVGVYLNVNPSSVEPLLIEIFDLKH